MIRARVLAAATVLTIAGGLVLAPVASARSSVRLPANWTNVGAALPGTVQSLVIHDGDLYAGGSFGTGFARWDAGAGAWVQLGTGGREIYALVSGPDGTLYAGGEMPLDGRDAPFVATWSGSDWKDIGVGSSGGLPPNSGWVRALTVTKDGHVYAGGIFTEMGGAQATNLAVFDGSTWSAPGSIQVITPVTSLASSGSGTVYVGAFVMVDGGYGYAASLTSGTWTRLDGLDFACSGVNPCLGVLDMVVDANGIVHAAGQLKVGSTVTAYATWNGRSWAAQPSNGLGLGVSIAKDDAGAIYASMGLGPGTPPWLVARMGSPISVLGDLGGRVGSYSLVVHSGTAYAAFTDDAGDPTAPWQVASFDLPKRAAASAVPRNVHVVTSSGRAVLAWRRPAFQRPDSYRVEYRIGAGRDWQSVRADSATRRAVLPRAAAGNRIDVRVRAAGGQWAVRSITVPVR